MRFTINLHAVRNDSDSIGNKFPLNTYVTDDVDKLLAELRNLLANDISGINKIVILDCSQDQEAALSEALVGQSQMELAR